MNKMFPFKSGYAIFCVTRSVQENGALPDLSTILPDLCRFDKFALPDLRPIFQFSPARDIQENKVYNYF